jgi:hypothetical protein
MKVSTIAPAPVNPTSGLIAEPAPQDTPSSPVQRMIDALRDPTSTFTADQVAWLMATAARWAREAVEEEPSPLSYAAGFDAGYRARVDEENAAYPPAPIWTAQDRQFIDQVDYRRTCDYQAGLDRVTDYAGGPVDWETGQAITPSFPRVRPTPASLPTDARSTATTPYVTGSAA